MRYFFIEYLANEMLPGDWEWYLESYSVDEKSGRRDWLVSGKLEAQVYEVPSSLRSHVVTAVSFAPPNAAKYSGKSLPAPPGVRWGILTCLRKDFFESIGEDVFFRNGTFGKLRDRDGAIVDDWVPILLNDNIRIDPRGNAVGAVCMKLLKGGELYDTSRYSLILREDIYQRVSHFRFAGCKTKLIA